MPFIKHDTRINRNGRPKERQLKNTELKILLNTMLNGYLIDIFEREKELTLRDKIQITRYVLPYVLPKLQSVTLLEPKDEFTPIEININEA